MTDLTSIINTCVTMTMVAFIASRFCDCISENIQSYIEVARINAATDAKRPTYSVGQSSIYTNSASVPSVSSASIGLYATPPANNSPASS